MTRRRFLSSILFFFLSQILSFAFNPLQSTQPQILQDVIEKIALKQKWELEGLNFSKLEVSKAGFGTGKRYEFRIRFGKNSFTLQIPRRNFYLEQVHQRNWRRFP
ncbi:hypothetical protein REPUB_Repub02eG0042300 [Reevesia pubescens]